jgi:2-aminoadipate transaminase
MLWFPIGMNGWIQLDQASDAPLYRQLYESLRAGILQGIFLKGDRLPATRELAQELNLNRATVSAAYALLESEGLIRGHVGRGSFVTGAPPAEIKAAETISFATSRPLEEMFPVEDFRATMREVASDPALTTLLQLGSAQGYAPLRQYLGGEDVLITSGCQQALDLLQRVLAPPGATVLVEDPTYPGIKNLFQAAGVTLAPLTAAPRGATLAIVVPNFQNPTGHTMTLDERERLLRLARDRGFSIVEIDLYTRLRYAGEDLPSLVEMDSSGRVIQIGSFSKVAFPGLRTGWIKAPREILRRLTEAKQRTDLHSDQLSQAVLLRFAESGRLAAHIARTVELGRRQLQAALDSLKAEMPAGTRFTKPEGGMNLWVTLPAPIDAAALLAPAREAGVTYLPGRFFEIAHHDAGNFRLSFGGLTPERIREGVALLGRVFRAQAPLPELATAIV